MNEKTQTTTTPTLPATTSLGPVTLAVSNLERSIAFYTRIIGLKVLSPATEEKPHAATMGAGQTPLLHLIEIPNARRQPSFTTGLFHVAILLPSRADLGRFLINVIRNQSSISRLGSSDHLVSEAIYLNDPDGNGLEIYRDRPRSEWEWDGSLVKMDTIAMDAEGVIASVPDQNAPYEGAPDGTVIGHMHLRAGDLALGKAFYVDTVGFDIITNYPGALFVSAGGYHHHLGMNIWQSQGAPRPPEDSVGLREFTIVIPDADALRAISNRLTNAGYPVLEAQETSFVSRDPWGNGVRFVSA
jgi:catechol 2,3-dioxygenase